MDMESGMDKQEMGMRGWFNLKKSILLKRKVIKVAAPLRQGHEM